MQQGFMLSVAVAASLLTGLNFQQALADSSDTEQPFTCGLEYFAPNVVDALTDGNPESYTVPKTKGAVRFASFNANLVGNGPGELASRLSTPDDDKAQNIAEIIQRTDPDVILLNEFDFDPTGQSVRDFQDNYLSVSQNGASPVEYPHVFWEPSNTGVPANTVDKGFGCSPFCDFDNNGEFGVLDENDFMTDPDDAYGFGQYPGRFAMVLLSKYPIDRKKARTFQKFRWKDMPGARLPSDDEGDWYSEKELEVFRLSSKSHWDVPIKFRGQTVHVLASHPTPPVFDGPEDRNGLRNADEIRFWADYVGSKINGRYIVDDRGRWGGLKRGRSFVIMGDQNADPFDGDSSDDAILQLLQHPAVNAGLIPSSQGGADAAERTNGANDPHLGSAVADTGDFNDAEGASGNLRADYVLPSKEGLDPKCAGIFWPREDDAFFDLVGDFDPDAGGFPGSDHRLVWMDVVLDRDYKGRKKRQSYWR